LAGRFARLGERLHVNRPSRWLRQGQIPACGSQELLESGRIADGQKFGLIRGQHVRVRQAARQKSRVARNQVPPLIPGPKRAATGKQENRFVFILMHVDRRCRTAAH
jgi:hypothetical protein